MIEQLAPASNSLPQLLICRKSPLVAKLVIRSEMLPVFVSVTVCAALVVPTSWDPNDKLGGEKLTSAIPVPPRLTE